MEEIKKNNIDHKSQEMKIDQLKVNNNQKYLIIFFKGFQLIQHAYDYFEYHYSEQHYSTGENRDCAGTIRITDSGIYKNINITEKISQQSTILYYIKITNCLKVTKIDDNILFYLSDDSKISSKLGYFVPYNDIYQIRVDGDLLFKEYKENTFMFKIKSLPDFFNLERSSIQLMQLLSNNFSYLKIKNIKNYENITNTVKNFERKFILDNNAEITIWQEKPNKLMRINIKPYNSDEIKSYKIYNALIEWPDNIDEKDIVIKLINDKEKISIEGINVNNNFLIELDGMNNLIIPKKINGEFPDKIINAMFSNLATKNINSKLRYNIKQKLSLTLPAGLKIEKNGNDFICGEANHKSIIKNNKDPITKSLLAESIKINDGPVINLENLSTQYIANENIIRFDQFYDDEDVTLNGIMPSNPINLLVPNYTQKNIDIIPIKANIFLKIPSIDLKTFEWNVLNENNVEIRGQLIDGSNIEINYIKIKEFDEDLVRINFIKINNTIINNNNADIFFSINQFDVALMDFLIIQFVQRNPSQPLIIGNNLSVDGGTHNLMINSQMQLIIGGRNSPLSEDSGIQIENDLILINDQILKNHIDFKQNELFEIRDEIKQKILTKNFESIDILQNSVILLENDLNSLLQIYSMQQKDFLGLGNFFTNTFPGWFNSAGNWLEQNIFNPVAGFFTETIPETFTQTIPNWFMTNIGNPAGSFFNSAIDILSKIILGISSIKNVINFVGTIAPKIKKLIERFGELFEYFGIAIDEFDKLINNLDFSSAATIIASLQKILNSIKENGLANFANRFKLGEVMNLLTMGNNGILHLLQEIINDKDLKIIADKINKITGFNLIPILNDVKNFLNKMKDTFNGVNNFLNNIPVEVNNFFNTANDVVNIINTGLNWMQNNHQSLSNIFNDIESLIGSFGVSFNNLSNFLNNSEYSFMENIMTILTNPQTFLDQIGFSNNFNSLSSILNNISNILSPRNIAEIVIEIHKLTGANIKDIFNNIFGIVVDLSNFTSSENITSMIDSLEQIILNALGSGICQSGMICKNIYDSFNKNLTDNITRGNKDLSSYLIYSFANYASNNINESAKLLPENHIDRLFLGIIESVKYIGPEALRKMCGDKITSVEAKIIYQAFYTNSSQNFI